jgi:hypothetical protein
LKIAFVLASICILGVPNLMQAAPTCDRQCLVNMMKNYLAALVKHDHAQAYLLLIPEKSNAKKLTPWERGCLARKAADCCP